MGGKNTTYNRIASEDIILGDASVVSRQWVLLPAGGCLPTPEQMLERYLVFLRRCTLSLVRPDAAADGIAFRLAGLRRPLLLFAPPESSRSGAGRSVALRIQGGLLAQQRECGRGLLTFTVASLPDGMELAIQVADYCPLLLGGPGPSRLRSRLYRSTQAIVHRLITVRFLAHFCRTMNRGSARRPPPRPPAGRPSFAGKPGTLETAAPRHIEDLPCSESRLPSRSCCFWRQGARRLSRR